MDCKLSAFERIEETQGRDAALEAARCWVRAAHGYEFGVEHVSAFDGWEEINPPSAAYVNRGDTYDETIVRMPDGSYELTSWGDVLEMLEEKRMQENNEARCPYCGEWYDIAEGPCHAS